MPNLPPRPCTHPRCRKMQTKRGKCDDHQQHGGWQSSESKDERYGINWRAIRKRIMSRDHQLCQACKRAKRYVQAKYVDHIIPKFEGGTDDDQNLEAICKVCHDKKSAQEAVRGRRAAAENRRTQIQDLE